MFQRVENVSFSKIVRKPKATKLELTHTDVWEPSTVTSFGSFNYVTSIDDTNKKYGFIFWRINLIFFMPSRDGSNGWKWDRFEGEIFVVR